MSVAPRKFFKPKIEGKRDRIDFASILEHSPDLGNRVLVVRSRVRDLREKFHTDCDWALRNFNIVTSVTIAVALLGVLLGVGISISFPAAALAAVASVAVGTIAGIAGAASKAFGWHKRYHAMFRARWAMASLEIQIDDLLYDLALDIEEGEPLSEQGRITLRKASNSWLSQIDATLRAFGDSYGAAISAAELRTKA